MRESFIYMYFQIAFKECTFKLSCGFSETLFNFKAILKCMKLKFQEKFSRKYPGKLRKCYDSTAASSWRWNDVLCTPTEEVQYFWVRKDEKRLSLTLCCAYHSLCTFLPPSTYIFKKLAKSNGPFSILIVWPKLAGKIKSDELISRNLESTAYMPSV